MNRHQDLFDERAADAFRTALAQRGKAFEPVALDPAGRGGGSRQRVVWRAGLVAAVLAGAFAVVSIVKLGGDADPTSPASTLVPDVVGVPGGQARKMLTAAGFDVVLEPSATCADPLGYVASQHPGPGTDAPRGSTVTVIDPTTPMGLCAGWGSGEASLAAHQLTRFARGSSSVTPPGWQSCLESGLCSAGVLPLLRQLDVTVTYRSSLLCGPAPQLATVMGGPGDDCPSPFAYLTANRRGVTSARLSTEQALTAAVPDVHGLSRKEALRRLEDAGFYVRARTMNLPGCDESGVVLRQSPTAGSQVRVGGTIHVAVNPLSDKNC